MRIGDGKVEEGGFKFCQEEEPLLTAAKYYWGCCMVCRKCSSPEEPLKRCGNCCRVFYCCKLHQRSDWKKHKGICAYLAKDAGLLFQDRQGLDATKGYGKSEEEGIVSTRTAVWADIRTCAAKKCQVALGRPLENYEKEIFLFPRICRFCLSVRRDQSMLDCVKCFNVSYCSSSHLKADAEHHERFCRELRFAMACDNYESTVSVASPPIPSVLAASDSDFASIHILRQDILQHLATISSRWMSQSMLSSDDISNSEEEMEIRFLTDRLTGPLTILHAAARVGLANGRGISDCETLTVHVVGSNVVEMLGIVKWEYLAHRLPRLKSLRYVFIGPELADHEQEGECEMLRECSECRDIGRTVRYEVRCTPYDVYVDYAAPTSTQPDIVCAFNCGFHEHSGEEDGWSVSLPVLIRHEGVPLIFTSYTATEARKDLKRLKKVCSEVNDNVINVEIPPSLNPYRSHRPLRDFEFDCNCDVFYANQYLTVIKRITKVHDGVRDNF